METTDYAVEALSKWNKYTAGYFAEKFPDEEACRKHLEEVRWQGTPTCPHCGCEKSYRLKDTGMYKCAHCHKMYNVKTKTIYHRTRIPLRKWFLTSYLLSLSKKGVSSVELSKTLGITQKSAWYLLHKIKFAIKDAGQKNLP